MRRGLVSRGFVIAATGEPRSLRAVRTLIIKRVIGRQGPGWQRGNGRRVLLAALCDAHSKGHQTALVESAQCTAQMGRFYGSVGFVGIDSRRKGQPGDAFIKQLDKAELRRQERRKSSNDVHQDLSVSQMSTRSIAVA